ncbi:HAD-IB family hydrolase [Candidatus Falkowbacteria bacterium HGW-Falkowbacteria-1]|uniref:phosphoserine phosphatase n=1 Tax=Candidatus Falkowbacteria bacterium HGW-Falkowbacteria-1 TaxID=2013768 RepID=A0A2N2E9S0_9BACT|nr:MAG: HAD-IB family hydrolase [Candidatus Falkowbacteria bacterium HGW-Falkowbacteria-1]
MKKNKIAIFDIDGTIFRSSLLIELVEALVVEGLFPENIRDTYIRAYKDWFNRRGSYEDYISAVVVAFEKNIKGINNNAFIEIAKQVVADNKDRVYRYTRDLIKKLDKDNYYLLAISHSPKAIVQDFCRDWGFDKVYGRDYEVDENNEFTGETLYLELISDKSKILKRVIEKENLVLTGSVGVGDSEGDITLLQMVERPICFNPNAKLYSQAKLSGWEVVIERKDVIYEI